MKGVLFGILLVLLGALCAFTIGPVLSLLIGATGLPLSSRLLAIGPLVGLALAIVGGIVGLRGYLSEK